MVDLLTIAYVVGFFVVFVGSMLWLTWHSLQDDAHSPNVGEADPDADPAE